MDMFFPRYIINHRKLAANHVHSETRSKNTASAMATLDITDYVLDTFNKGLNSLVHVLQVAEAHA